MTSTIASLTDIELPLLQQELYASLSTKSLCYHVFTNLSNTIY